MTPPTNHPTHQGAVPPVPPVPPSAAGWEEFALDPADLPNLDDVVIEDGAPLDSISTEKQLRLLTEPLYASWAGPGAGRPFLALANVGLFYKSGAPALVPDTMLSLDVSPAADLSVKGNRSYFTWLRGKVPDVVIEIVSDKRGGEDSLKLLDYARIGIPYYVVYDPDHYLGAEAVRGFLRKGLAYEATPVNWLPEIGLGLMVWEGDYEGQPGQWLRWCAQDGTPIPTGRERAEQMQQVAEQERQRRERLEAQLRALGAEPSA